MLRQIMNISEDASTREAVQEITMRAIESKTAAAAVAAGTAALGLADLQSIASLLATVAAFLLSVTLIIKHTIDAYRSWVKAKKEDEKDSINT